MAESVKNKEKDVFSAEDEMLHITTSTGFETDVYKDCLDDFEAVRLLGRVQKNDLEALEGIFTLILGEEERDRLYDHLRSMDKRGRVRTSLLNNELKAFFDALGEDAKN